MKIAHRKALSLMGEKDVLFPAAIVLGLAAGSAAQAIRPYIFPILGAAMTLAVIGVPNSVFKPSSAAGEAPLAKAVGWGLALNYLLLGSLFALCGLAISGDESLRNGFIMLALAPPAVAVAPFSTILGGDRRFSLAALVGAYLAAPIIFMILGPMFWGSAFIDPLTLVEAGVLLILLPVVVSRVVHGAGWAGAVEKRAKPLINWCFFTVIYAIVGLNAEYLLNLPREAVSTLVCVVALSFGLGPLLVRLCRRLGLPESMAVSVMLLGVMKNHGVAAGLALNAFDERAAIPAVLSALSVITFIVLQSAGKRLRTGGSDETTKA